jgi:hypothetical protein
MSTSNTMSRRAEVATRSKAAAIHEMLVAKTPGRASLDGAQGDCAVHALTWARA